MKKMCPHEKDTNGDAGTKRRKQTAFSCPPTSPAFSKELQSQSCLHGFNYSCTLVIFPSFFFFPVSRAHKEQSLGQQGSSLRNGFYFEGHFPSKIGNGAACGVEAVMNFDTKTRSTPAWERLLPKVFPASQRLTFKKKSANHSFQAPSVTP